MANVFPVEVMIPLTKSVRDMDPRHRVQACAVNANVDLQVAKRSGGGRDGRRIAWVRSPAWNGIPRS